MGVREVVLAALDSDDPRERTAIVEETALTEKQVGNALNNLKNDGKCKRVAEGWIRTGSDTPPQAPTPATVAPPRSVREPKVKPVKKRAPNKAITPIKGRAVAIAGNGELHFVLTERMELGIERPGGARGVLSAAEAVRLHDFLTMVRPALEARR